MKIKPTPTLINIKIKSSRSIRSIHNATTRHLSDISNEIKKKKRRKKGQPIRKKKKEKLNSLYDNKK